MPCTWMIRRNYATIYCSPTGNSTLPSLRMPLRRRTLPGQSIFRSLIPIRSLRRALSLRRRPNHPKHSNEEVGHIMKRTIVRLLSFAVALLPFNTASAYSHANRYGGSTSHSEGSTSHSSAYGTSSSHTYGEGSSHTNEYGGSTSHSAYGGTSHTNAYGGTTSGEAGYGATHTNTYGGTTSGAYGEGAEHTTPYGSTTYASAYHPPAAYYPYHPPTTVGYYGAGCYNCSSGSTAGAAAVGAVVGMATGAAIASSASSSQSAAASQNAYAQGYNAGASNTANAAAANANAAAANANAAAANANVAAAYAMGSVHGALPAGCIQPSVAGGGTYYLCGNTWFSPAYGANGVHYTVVPAP